MSDYLFISDLHLSPERPEIIQLFLKFMDEIAPTTKSLYILGDFLEYWIGDDMEEKIQGTALMEVFSSLKTLNDKGTDVFFMHGNRDFLIGQKLADKYHFKLIDDPTTIQIEGTPVLLMHGDTLCTDDIDYQNLRSMLRDEKWKNDFLSKSLTDREQMAKNLREKSKEAVTNKKPDIMDINQEALLEIMQKYKVTQLIHGHTHRPASHSFSNNGVDMQRFVLTDWYETGGYLEVTNGIFNSHTLN